MSHLFIQKERQYPPLLLLHGTGGDEHSLVELASSIAPHSSLLSIRGKVSEGGANRYFKRFAEGQFDLVDLENQADSLLADIRELAQRYDLPVSELVILGYSNGANMGTHLLLEREESLNRGILFHPMSLGKHEQTFSLSHQRVWLSYGEADPIVPEETFTSLVEVFESRGAAVSVYRSAMSHGLTYAELEEAKKWFEELY